jgi:hypothetical protein
VAADGATSATADEAIARVAAIHGGNGPWAVAGYRMGQHALARLGLPQQSFDLEVVHHSPRSVQYSCIADGAAAATGASLGKLNLSMVEADEAHTETTYRRRSTGQTVTLRTTAAFAARFRDLPREKLGEAGRSVMGLRDDEIFEEPRPSPQPLPQGTTSPSLAGPGRPPGPEAAAAGWPLPAPGAPCSRRSSAGARSRPSATSTTPSPRGSGPNVVVRSIQRGAWAAAAAPAAAAPASGRRCSI